MPTLVVQFNPEELDVSQVPFIFEYIGCRLGVTALSTVALRELLVTFCLSMVLLSFADSLLGSRYNRIIER